MSNDYEMVAILMSRDGMSREEVTEQINDFKEEILINGCYDVEEEFMVVFGLEPDYLIDILF
jgi:hypothetical protein